MGVLRAPAHAKINLALEVLGRRDDGYHDIVSVVQTISLHDVVVCSPAPALSVRTDPPVLSHAENLVTRAADLLAEELGRSAAADVLVRKRIPLAAGLGGGSSNAATALRLLARLWRADLAEDDLLRLANRLGSDVALFLVGGTVLIRGRGDRVVPIPDAPSSWLALACPACPLPDKTRTLYGGLRRDDWTDGRRTLALADRLRRGQPAIDGPLPNAFDRAAEGAYPNFADLRRRLGEAAEAPVYLTGAGPSLFARFRTEGEAGAAAARMAKLGVACHVATFRGRQAANGDGA